MNQKPPLGEQKPDISDLIFVNYKSLLDYQFHSAATSPFTYCLLNILISSM